MTNPALKRIFASLKELGLTKAQAVAILPSWWEPQIAETDDGLWETVALLARRLSLDVAALHDGLARPSEASTPRFKHTVRVTDNQLRAATLIASSVSRAVLGAMPERSPNLPSVPQALREQILATSGSRVDFDSMLAFCWESGVPVIPLPNVPRGVRKMDAATLKIGHRPAIVIALKSNSKAWLSFLLAHELGHVGLGHVTDNTSLVEGSIGDTTEFDAESQLDQQEKDANAYALTLLGGEAVDKELATWPDRLPPVSMATMAMDAAPSLHVSPGHLVLRRAFTTGRWPDARQALNFLSDDMDAQASLLDRLRQKINTAALGDDLQDYVEQITGIPPRN